MKNLPIVLVVEDDKAIVHLLSTILDANDYRVVQVSTGREALSTISSHCPDVVLLDLGLPDMDGVDIIKNVRQWSQVPIIVLSARNRERDKVEALDLGADDYVTKPFGTAELLGPHTHSPAPRKQRHAGYAHRQGAKRPPHHRL